MTIDMISESARKICRKYDETDPYRLAKAMKIIIRFVPMGFYKGCCKGFFMVHRRIKHIMAARYGCWRKAILPNKTALICPLFNHSFYDIVKINRNMEC